MCVFGLWPLPQNFNNYFAFGDLTRLGPVAKVMCPPKFVLVLVEDLRVTARSYSRSAFSHPVALSHTVPLDAHVMV